MAQSTEERIAQIAQSFGQGFQNFNQGQQAQRAQRSQAEEIALRKRAMGLELEGKLSEQTGKQLVGTGIGEQYLAGNSGGLGDLLNKAPTTRKVEMENAARERQARLDENTERYQNSIINKNNASAAGPGGMGKPSMAEQSVDRNFAKTYDDFIVGGGYSKVSKGLTALKAVSKNLGRKGSDLTGPLTGRTPEFIQSFTNPMAIETRDQVGSVIQDNLKAILGASYTEGEGNRVIERAYNPKLSEKANKVKLDALITQMESAAKAKIEAAKYFEANGSMRGYKGTQINSLDDIFGTSGGESDEPIKPWEKYKK